MSISTEHHATTTTGDSPDAAGPAIYRAAVVHEFHAPLSLDQVPAVKLAAGQVRVKVEASGLCHTDIHAAHGDWPVKPSPPFIPGHEGVGIVVEAAPDVTEVVLGDRVAMPWLGYACGTCDHCVSAGRPSAIRRRTWGTRSTARSASTPWRSGATSSRCRTPSTRSTPPR